MSRPLKDNFQLTLIIIVSTLISIFIGPFAVFRFLEGNYVVALADTIMVVTALFLVVIAWRTGETRKTGFTISLICSIGALVVSLSIAIDGVFWIYPLIMFIFHLTPAITALIMISGVVITVSAYGFIFPGTIFSTHTQSVSYIISTLTTITFSYLFANRNKQHRKQLLLWATKDALTGLNNRRNLENELHLAVATKEQLGLNFGLLVADIDHFKEINDNMGHAEGDRILRELAYLLSSSIRLSDAAFRYGGDEFVILLSNINDKGLKEVCSNILKKVPATISCGDSSITVSIGGALLRNNDTTEAWFARADKSLYQAKQKGRNCFYTCSEN